MGSGKTYVASHLAASNDLSLCVICPAGMRSKWLEVAESAGAKVFKCLSFESLRGQSGDVEGTVLKHGLLVRRDVRVGTVVKPYFTPTAAWRRAVCEGVLLVVDEAQRLKNWSIQSQAVHSLAKCIIAQYDRTSSRQLLLSGTPFDKKEHAMHLLRLMLSYDDEIYTKANPQSPIEFTPGMCEVMRLAMDLDRCATTTLMSRHGVSRDAASGTVFSMPRAKGLVDFMYKLYVDVLQGVMTKAMPPPPIAVGISCMNASFEMRSVETLRLQDAVAALSTAVKSLDQKGPRREKEGLGAVTRACLSIEIAKAPLFFRLAEKTLRANPQAKVVLAFNYLKPLRHVLDLLRKTHPEWRPLELSGTLSKGEFDGNVSLFQQPNTDHRVLCGIMAVMDVGIDLDDTVGVFPRVAYANTTYRPLSSHQFTRRFHRLNTKSVPDISFVHCQRVDEESVMRSLQRKTAVLSDTLPVQVAAGIVFPADYEKVEEMGPFQELGRIRVSVHPLADDMTLGLGHMEKYDGELSEEVVEEVAEGETRYDIMPEVRVLLGGMVEREVIVIDDDDDSEAEAEAEKEPPLKRARGLAEDEEASTLALSFTF